MNRRWRCLMLLAVLAVAGVRLTAAPAVALRDGDRVLFLGDTFIEREVDYGILETALTMAFPDRRITFRNLGWAADTPLGRSRASFDWNKSGADWLKRVQEQVALVEPTVVVMSHGMSAALGEPDGSGQPDLEPFGRDLVRLMDAIREVSGPGVRFVVLGPAVRPSDGPAELSATFAERERRLDLVQRTLESVADAQGAAFLAFHDFSKPAAAPRSGNPTSPDGVVPKPAGYALLSGPLVVALGGTVLPAADDGDAAAGVQVLNAAIRKKNELFFHRWRPANWTYLFGFRKHEQGQNAVEIPKFDPLIEAWDARIAALRHPGRQDAAVVAEVRTATAGAAGRDHRDPNYKEQPLPTFEVAPGFEVSLWAENPMLYKPIQMNWDPQGRLWVASSRLYPQIQPGQDAEDAVIVLEDTNGDGRADTHTVFAEGLVIPTGVVPDGRGGCYVAASHQLLHVADRDGDGRGDETTIVLSSFGTEDTHHNLHTLRWGFDGHLYLNQSIYTHTHVETPHGVRRLNSAGIWRFQPDTWSLEIFTKGGCNPWGHHWDQYGNSFFTDGAGFKGIYHAMEGATYFTYADMRREAESISPGNYPKFASLEIVHSPMFPADWQGNVLTCDFRAHRIVRFQLTDVGSTFQTREMPDLLRSTNVTFRPIDLRFGPDGALYIADWSNPIIQHGEVDFRDPRRDHEHGRIWRVAASGARPTGPAPDLTRLSTPELLDRTLSANGWEQEQSRVVLRQRGGAAVAPELSGWLARQTDPRARLEVLWLQEAFGQPTEALVGELIANKDERLRTAAARQLRHRAGVAHGL
ncbi:MAG: hypothetical protein KF791_00400 [Verrucomicrobiae bacterium]|nr:hypothetical protein [Verrucomicrobiae bacterium]